MGGWELGWRGVCRGNCHDFECEQMCEYISLCMLVQTREVGGAGNRRSRDVEVCVTKGAIPC